MLTDTSGTGLTGNDRFEGFGVDIIEQLANMYGFKYEFVVQEDGDYGRPIQKGNSTEWTGMIGEVMAGVSKQIIKAHIIENEFKSSTLDVYSELIWPLPT